MTTKYLDISSLIGTKVRCYRNLHNDLISIQVKSAVGWRVAGHASSFDLEDAFFRVSEAGRQRVLATGKKNVHAFIEGIVTDICTIEPPYKPVSYNPKSNSFFEVDGNPVSHANLVVFRNCRPFIAFDLA